MSAIMVILIMPERDIIYVKRDNFKSEPRFELELES